MNNVTLTIAGMGCGHCVGSVRDALAGVGGVTVENVEVGSASVSYDPATTSPAEIERVIEGAGYAVVRAMGNVA